MKRWHVAGDDPGHSADLVSLRTMTCPTTAFLWQVLTLNKEYSFELASLFNSIGKKSGQLDDRLCDCDAKSKCFAFVPPHAPALRLMRASRGQCVELRLKTKNE